jgi:hypothetical protein
MSENTLFSDKQCIANFQEFTRTFRNSKDVCRYSVSHKTECPNFALVYFPFLSLNHLLTSNHLACSYYSNPSYLLTYVPTYLLTYLPISTYLLTYLLTYLPTYLLTYLPTCIPTYLPTKWLFDI